MLQILRSGALILALSGAALLAPGVRAQDDFVRGDVDSSGRFEVTDAIAILRALFGGEPERIACEDAADVDDSGLLAVTDAISLLEALFRGGPPPAAPFPACGPDPTEDGLGCEAHEACRTIFTFFGVPIAADAVFFVIDNSTQIRRNGIFALIKTEVTQALEALPKETRFAIVFFDAFVIRFPAGTVPATADAMTKESAKAFLEAVRVGSGTCPLPALIRALQYIEGSSVRRPVVLHMTDGGGTCMGGDEWQYIQRTVDEVTEANAGRARIFTFGFSVVSDAGRRYLQDLASRNGGAFTEVQ
jgi:hypothetical protein